MGVIMPMSWLLLLKTSSKHTKMIWISQMRKLSELLIIALKKKLPISSFILMKMEKSTEILMLYNKLILEPNQNKKKKRIMKRNNKNRLTKLQIMLSKLSQYRHSPNTILNYYPIFSHLSSITSFIKTFLKIMSPLTLPMLNNFNKISMIISRPSNTISLIMELHLIYWMSWWNVRISTSHLISESVLF